MPASEGDSRLDELQSELGTAVWCAQVFRKAAMTAREDWASANEEVVRLKAENSRLRAGLQYYANLPGPRGKRAQMALDGDSDASE